VAAASRISPWRKWTGITLFVLHLVLPVIALIVVPIFGFPEGVNAILIGLSVFGGAPGWGFWVLLASTFAFIGAVIAMGAPL
jgi:hypothetical protein